MIVQVGRDLIYPNAISRRVGQEARVLLEAGYKVAVISNRPPVETTLDAGKLPEHLPPGVVLRCIRDRSPRRPLPQVAQQYLLARDAAAELQRLHAEQPIRLVVCPTSTVVADVVRRFARPRGVPVVFVIQALIRDRLRAGKSPYDRWTTLAYRWSNRRAVRLADWCVSVSAAMRETAIEIGGRPQRQAVLLNPIDLDRFQPLATPDRDIDVLYFGRLSPEKGITTLADMLRRLPENLRVMIIGDGVERPALESAAAQAACHVELAGELPNAHLPNYLARARVVVIPSLSEPQGVVALEAMASGVPVVASRVGGLPEMIDTSPTGRTGWLVEPGNADALTRTVLEVLADEPGRAQVASQAATAARAFGMPGFTGNLLRLYRGILGGTNANGTGLSPCHLT